MKNRLDRLILVVTLMLVVTFTVSMENQLEEKIDRNIIAIVNHTAVTKEYFEKKYQSLSPQYKNVYKNDKEGFLDQIINAELIYQETEKMGFGKGLNNVTDLEMRKNLAMKQLLRGVTERVKISEAEMLSFYNEKMTDTDKENVSFEQAKPRIEHYLTQRKQAEAINQYFRDLRKKAHIVINEDWIKAQRALKPRNPLVEALKNGMPTVLQLGVKDCHICESMKPIFAELKQEYKGKANVIELDISEHRDLERKYRIWERPTQIIFDKNGHEYWRHEGFLSREEIVKKLVELEYHSLIHEISRRMEKD